MRRRKGMDLKELGSIRQTETRARTTLITTPKVAAFNTPSLHWTFRFKQNAQKGSPDQTKVLGFHFKWFIVEVTPEGLVLYNAAKINYRSITVLKGKKKQDGRQAGKIWGVRSCGEWGRKWKLFALGAPNLSDKLTTSSQFVKKPQCHRILL